MDIQNENGPDEFNELDVLFSMVEERNRKLDEQLKTQIETRRAVEKTLRLEEEARLKDLNRLGSFDQAAAVARENIRKSELERDANRRKRRAQADLDNMY